MEKRLDCVKNTYNTDKLSYQCKMKEFWTSNCARFAFYRNSRFMKPCTRTSPRGKIIRALSFGFGNLKVLKIICLKLPGQSSSCQESKSYS